MELSIIAMVEEGRCLRAYQLGLFCNMLCSFKCAHCCCFLRRTYCTTGCPDFNIRYFRGEILGQNETYFWSKLDFSGQKFLSSIRSLQMVSVWATGILICTTETRHASFWKLILGPFFLRSFLCFDNFTWPTVHYWLCGIIVRHAKNLKFSPGKHVFRFPEFKTASTKNSVRQSACHSVRKPVLTSGKETAWWALVHWCTSSSHIIWLKRGNGRG